MNRKIEWYKIVRILKPICRHFANSNYCSRRDDIPLCICNDYDPEDDSLPKVCKMFIDELKSKIIKELPDIAGDIATGICLETNNWNKLDYYAEAIQKRLHEFVENIFSQFE